MSVNGIKPVDFTTTSTTDLWGAGTIVRTDDGRKAYRWVLAAAALAKDNLVYHSDKKKGIAKTAQGTADPAGIPLVAIASASYGWLQYHGLYPNALTKPTGTNLSGLGAIAPGATNGEITAAAATSNDIGIYIGANLTTETVVPAGTVDLNIPD